jgi:hypothetical protein
MLDFASLTLAASLPHGGLGGHPAAVNYTPKKSGKNFMTVGRKTMRRSFAVC